jgi:hypothetical protein
MAYVYSISYNRTFQGGNATWAFSRITFFLDHEIKYDAQLIWLEKMLVPMQPNTRACIISGWQLLRTEPGTIAEAQAHEAEMKRELGLEP